VFVRIVDGSKWVAVERIAEISQRRKYAAESLMGEERYAIKILIRIKLRSPHCS
jgi:hypothetical protein